MLDAAGIAYDLTVTSHAGHALEVILRDLRHDRDSRDRIALFCLTGGQGLRPGRVRGHRLLGWRRHGAGVCVWAADAA